MNVTETITDFAVGSLTVANPYLDAFLEWFGNDIQPDGSVRLRTGLATGWFDVCGARDDLVKKYSWAIPSAAALAEIIKHGPIIEAGAGAGYWSMLLAAAGGDVIAFDEAPAGLAANHFTGTDRWFDVRFGGTETVAANSERTLFMCWPPYDTPFALNTLHAYTGDTVCYVGEGYGGCTGDDDFHEQLTLLFEQTASVNIPKWFGLHDDLTVWSRR